MKKPKLNGLEVYQQVKKNQPEIVTILMTGYTDEMKALLDYGIQEKVHACLAKPLEMGRLVSLLNDIFNVPKGNGLKKEGL